MVPLKLCCSHTTAIATEYVDGETLRQRLAAGRLAVPEASEIAEQAPRADGIVHRDIKPENVMLHRDGYSAG